MPEKTRLLVLSANPRPCGRIQVDEEAREIYLKLEEGPCRDKFEVRLHTATRPIDIQRLLLKYRPHIVHFSGHGHKTQRLILSGAPGRGKTVDKHGLARVFDLYKHHVKLVVLNACFTEALARSITQTIDYAIGAGKGIGDTAGVAFAGAFYRALGFGKSVKDAFASAQAELALTKTPRAQGIALFVRNGVDKRDRFPRTNGTGLQFYQTGQTSEPHIAIVETLIITRFIRQVYLPARRREALERRFAPGFINHAR
jgi:CHAT domain